LTQEHWWLSFKQLKGLHHTERERFPKKGPVCVRIANRNVQNKGNNEPALCRFII
jgi:hypothetical protein